MNSAPPIASPPRPAPSIGIEFSTISVHFIALLPVRIETRFFLSQLVRNELRVAFTGRVCRRVLSLPSLPAEIGAAQDY